MLYNLLPQQVYFIRRHNTAIIIIIVSLGRTEYSQALASRIVWAVPVICSAGNIMYEGTA